MFDDPLKQPNAPREKTILDAVILWVLVALFGVIWVLVVFYNNNPADALSDPFLTTPPQVVQGATRDVLLGMGGAIIAIGVGGGIGAGLRFARRAPAERPLARPAKRVCEGCGAEVAPDFAFCPHCARPIRAD